MGSSSASVVTKDEPRAHCAVKGTTALLSKQQHPIGSCAIKAWRFSVKMRLRIIPLVLENKQ